MSLPINNSRFVHIETSQFISNTISSANQLTDFYMMVTLASKGLISFLKSNSKKQSSNHLPAQSQQQKHYKKR